MSRRLGTSLAFDEEMPQRFVYNTSRFVVSQNHLEYLLLKCLCSTLLPHPPPPHQKKQLDNNEVMSFTKSFSNGCLKESSDSGETEVFAIVQTYMQIIGSNSSRIRQG